MREDAVHFFGGIDGERQPKEAVAAQRAGS
jgi:hypothetical protein